jgi:hypothetical protein
MAESDVSLFSGMNKPMGTVFETKNTVEWKLFDIM